MKKPLKFDGHAYQSNGRTERAIKRMEYWQQLLNDGYSVEQVVEVAIEHRKDKATARCQYRDRIYDLLAVGELVA